MADFLAPDFDSGDFDADSDHALRFPFQLPESLNPQTDEPDVDAQLGRQIIEVATGDNPSDARLGRQIAEVAIGGTPSDAQLARQIIEVAISEGNPTVDHTLDAVLQATSTETHTLDAVLVDRLSATHTLDAILQATDTKTHTVDAVLGVPTVTHTIDAFLATIQYSRPDSDIDAGSWKTAPTPSQPLWQQIDEVTPSTTDYIYNDEWGA